MFDKVQESEQGETRDDRPDISLWGPSNECRQTKPIIFSTAVNNSKIQAEGRFCYIRSNERWPGQSNRR